MSSIRETLTGLQAAIAASAPALAEVKTAVDTLAPVVAAAIPQAAPVIQAIQQAEAVAVAAAPIVQAVTTPLPAAAAVSPAGVDSASIAAGAVSGAATQTVDTLHTRLSTIESAVNTVIPLLLQIAKEMGLD